MTATKSATTTAFLELDRLSAHREAAGRRDLAYLLEASGRRHLLRTSTTRIGRLDDNDIVLGGSGVSREHSVIVRTEHGFVIHDLRSTNGVAVQEELIREPTGLRDGDQVRIGNHAFTFHLAENAPAQPAPREGRAVIPPTRS